MSQAFRLAFSLGREVSSAFLPEAASQYQHRNNGGRQIAPAGRARISTWVLVWGLLAAALLLL